MMTKERNHLQLTKVEEPKKKVELKSPPLDFFDFEQTTLSGEKISMSDLKGKKAFLVINVASKSLNSKENYQWMAKM